MKLCEINVSFCLYDFSIFLPPRVFWTLFIQETNHKTADSHPYGKKDGIYIEQQGAERANLFFFPCLYNW